MFPISKLMPIDRHKFILNNYVLNKQKSTEKRDSDVIRENHKFLWETETPSSWEERLAKKYYDKLFKEYCISDLTYYKENKIALRWRIEKEVVIGKGQFICGNRKCEQQKNLKTWEVNFAYKEQGERKNALIKLRLCPPCSEKLNYRSKKREIKRQKHCQKKEENKRKSTKKSNSFEDTSNDGSNLKITDKSDLNIETEEPREAEIEKPGNVWEGKDTSVENIVREDEFGKYLEDLLL